MTGIVLVAILLLGLLYAVNPLANGSGEDDGIPAYRAANGIYIANAIEGQRVALMAFQERFGELPGDSPDPMEIDGRQIIGNANGRIEIANGEKDKVFPELVRSGIVDAQQVRIRGKVLEVGWADLREGDRLLASGNFFILRGIHELEARAYDLKFDDGRSDSGNVLFSKNKDGGVNLYVKFNFFG